MTSPDRVRNSDERRRHRRRPRRADGGRGAGAGGARVTVYDAMPSAGRKFLMAGRGGLNLTHSEALPQFLARYGEATPHLKPRSRRFRRMRCARGARRWGSRPSSAPAAGCFRKRFKASPLLRAWLRRLDASGVQFALRHRWTGWDADGRSRVRDAGRTAHRRCARDRAGARRRQLAAARIGWRMGGNARREGRRDIAAAAGQLRLHCRLVRHLPRPF